MFSDGKFKNLKKHKKVHAKLDIKKEQVSEPGWNTRHEIKSLLSVIV